MVTPPRSEERILECVAAYQQTGSLHAGSRLLNMDRMTFKRHVREAVDRGFISAEGAWPGSQVKATSERFDKDGNPAGKTISRTREPGEEFQIPEGHRVKGTSAYLDADGRIIGKWVKTSADSLSIDLLRDALTEAFSDFRGNGPSPTLSADTQASLATVYALADLHVGLLTWGRETGTDWDIEIATTAFNSSLDQLIALTPQSDTAVILVLGDLLHIDGYAHVTPQSGNHLDADGRYPKTLRVAATLIARTVTQALHKHREVIVRVLPGNHDTQSAGAVSLALSMLFDGNERVKVDDSPSYFWFWEWGATLMGATHGDKAKMKDLPLVMAQQRSEAWGRTKHKVIYTGHIHTQTAIELNGVRVESFQSPVPADAWHQQMGYGAGRSFTAITHHLERGEVARNREPVI